MFIILWKQITMLYCLILTTFFILFSETIAYPQKEMQRDTKETKKDMEMKTKPTDKTPTKSLNLLKTDEESICDDEICNHRGTCIGTNDTNFCICKIGYSGLHCETSPCDSTRDCNGKGLCIGTSTKFTCMCQLGFTGDHCENGIIDIKK
uniref:EGF-like domain-containing protein n=2 Tax=Onchocerca TaxID=6281 RepID=A0A8R1Y503_ONCVO